MIKSFKEFIEDTQHPNYSSSSNKNVQHFLDSLTESELKEIWIDYEHIIHPTNYSNPLTILMRQNINEGLVSTYPIDKTIEYVKKYFKFKPVQIYKTRGEGGVYFINVYIPNTGNNFKILKKAMMLCGWYLAIPKETELPKDEYVALQFEPEFQNDESKKIRSEENTILHVTPKYNEGKIKHIGFSPRCKNEIFDFPSRVYFLKGSTPKEEIKHICKQLSNTNSSKGNTGEYIIFTLDLDKVPNDVKMYLDPNYEWGIFTKDNIKPDTIISTEDLKI